MARGAAVRLVAAMLGVWVLAGVARAETAKAYTCSFDAGMVHTFENGAFSSKAAQKLAFEIGDIDFARQSAALVTPKGKGELRIVRAIGANHFLEVITEGFLNITTIYEAGPSGGPYPAVHSRHFGLLGTPVVSQYRGSCREQ